MRKIAKILLCISCLLPLTCFVAFAEEVKLPDGNVVEVNPYYGIDDHGCPLDEYGSPSKLYYDLFYSQTEPLTEETTHVDDIYVPGFVYVGDTPRYSVTYSSTLGFHFKDVADVDVGDVVVAYVSDDVGYVVFDVVSVSQGTSSDRTVISPRVALEEIGFTSEYFIQHYDPINPINFVSLIGDWIIGCFSTVALVLTGFASDNEWVTLFLLVIPLSGLIFAFVKSLIARR